MSVEPVAYGCPWPVDPACFEDAWESLDDSVRDRSLALASATLRRLTGFRVGGCPITVRPCQQGCAGDFPSYSMAVAAYGRGSGWWPQNMGGVWSNTCGCSGECHCGPALCQIRLPAPATRIDEVKIDGAVIDPELYALKTTGRGEPVLRWVDADTPCPWPTCQDLSLPDTEENTFSVTYLNSHPVDSIGAYAAGLLAMEFAKACSGNKGCRLPSGVRTVTRQGVSYDIQPGAFPDGFTGIREVDTYIALWNPKALTQGARVWSPDLPTAAAR